MGDAVRHWPILLVAVGVISGGLIYGVQLSEIPVGFQRFRCERLPSSDEATYPPFWSFPDAQLFDVHAPVEEVMEHFKKSTPITYGGGHYEFTNSEGTFYLFAGAVWSYEDDPRIPGPPNPSPRGRTIVLTREAPGLRSRVRASILERLWGKGAEKPLRIGYLGDIEAKTELGGV